MSRIYYLSVEVTCDKCGIKDTLDNGSENEASLNAHVANYYAQIDGKDLCEDCQKEVA